LCWCNNVDRKRSTRTLSTSSKDFGYRESDISQARQQHLGAMQMQTSTWITRGIGVMAAMAAAAFTTGSASADGYQRRGVAPVAVGCANFGGFYVGGNIGWATLTAHQNDLDGVTNVAFQPYGIGVPTSFTSTDDSFTGGVLIGYNIQKGCTLFGLEADWNWADLNANTRLFPGLAPFGVDENIKTRIDGFGTIRTRTGVVVDQLLLYVTGGLAWAETKDTVGLFGDRFSSTDTRWGWVGGVGTEYLLRSNISLTSDLLYLSFTDQNHNLNFGGIWDGECVGCRFRTRTDDQIWVARMGVNIRFGGERDFVAAPLK
jgi:outer membrane immunogenic protein